MKMVFDSSSVISVSQTCLINILEGLQERLGQLIMPEAVYREAVQRPIAIKRFELNAVRIKKAIDNKWFTVSKVSNKRLFSEIDAIANNCLYAKGKPIRLLQAGEIESLCLIKEQGAESFAIDERTTRMLIESPNTMKNILQARRRINIKVDKRNSRLLQEMFKETSIVRSVELIALAFEHGLLEKELPKGKQSLEAALFAAKYSGCAVSSREINMFLHSQKAHGG